MVSHLHMNINRTRTILRGCKLQKLNLVITIHPNLRLRYPPFHNIHLYRRWGIARRYYPDAKILHYRKETRFSNIRQHRLASLVRELEVSNVPAVRPADLYFRPLISYKYYPIPTLPGYKYSSLARWLFKTVQSMCPYIHETNISDDEPTIIFEFL